MWKHLTPSLVCDICSADATLQEATIEHSGRIYWMPQCTVPGSRTLELVQDIKAHLQRRRTCYSSAKNTLHFCFSITQGCSNTNKATGWEPPQVCNCLSLVTWSCPWPLWAHYSYWEKDRLDYLNFRAYIQAHSSITVTLRTEVE